MDNNVVFLHQLHAPNLQAPNLQLCLDFANTMDWHASAQPVETLQRYADLVAWAQRGNLLTDQAAQQLVLQAEQAPAGGKHTLAQALALREAIYRIFVAVAARQTPAAADLASLNAILPSAISHLQITQTTDGFVWAWTEGEQPVLDQMLWPIIRSAAELLVSKELSRVRQCADDRGCGFLFLDTTRNRSRRWCTMEGCGNRAKARRHYQRQQSDQ